ncbi:DUF4344 domain-containing metallopeptidase [Roseibium marinum]|uniref:Putative metallopeptidase DUF4344 n=1 Tax=Roseibium marinum TaxID=281252 RepID=A0A2S3UMI2_9HYPH|nr:DUF4344 domain-containing metallopeptidase [Roseibium marinum]POF28780.1 putative metallopeptidase DUF4344 [Roseibium marinum]
MTRLAAIPGRLATLVSGGIFFLAFFCLAAVLTQAGAQENENYYANLEEDLAELSAEEREELLLFVAGNALHTLYHEGGHMLISLLELPVLAQEEDAVDNLATVTMLEIETGDVDLMLRDAMIGWFLMAETTGENLVFYDEHDLDLQRGFRMLCLMVGADEEAFMDLARELDLPEDRIESCAFDYAQASESWQLATASFARESNTPAGRIKAVHDPAPEGLKILAQFLKTSELLEDVAKEFDTRYDIPEDITFRAAACGEDNAFWDPEAREVILCHEMLGAFADLYLGLLYEEE